MRVPPPDGGASCYMSAHLLSAGSEGWEGAGSRRGSPVGRVARVLVAMAKG